MKLLCPKHKVELVCFCPICRGESGGKRSAKGMTAEQRKERARKAAFAKHAKERK